jgi:hypothetical protein
MDLQTRAVGREWLSSNHMGTPINTNATMATATEEWCFHTAHAKILYEGEVSGVESVSEELAGG